MNEISKDILIAATVWFVFSLCGSAIKAEHYACDKNYIIDRMLYTKLFCEVKNEH